MPDEFPAIVYTALQSLREEFTASHARVRDDLVRLDAQTQSAHRRLSEQITDLRLLCQTIQTERHGEQAAVVRRSAWVSLLAAAGLSAAVECVRRVFGVGGTS